jgi:hypothetical protein
MQYSSQFCGSITSQWPLVFGLLIRDDKKGRFVIPWLRDSVPRGSRSGMRLKVFVQNEIRRSILATRQSLEFHNVMSCYNFPRDSVHILTSHECWASVLVSLIFKERLFKICYLLIVYFLGFIFFSDEMSVYSSHGLTRWKTFTHTGQHDTKKRGHISVPRVRFL